MSAIIQEEQNLICSECGWEIDRTGSYSVTHLGDGTAIYKHDDSCPTKPKGQETAIPPSPTPYVY